MGVILINVSLARTWLIINVGEEKSKKFNWTKETSSSEIKEHGYRIKS